MKKIILTLVLLSISLLAEVTNQYMTKDFLKKDIPIVDIRTPMEWKETGILKGALPIMFFDQNGGYNARKFLTELNKKVDTTKPFAIICRSGHRSSLVAPWLSKELHYKVINLKGGMNYVLKDLHIQTTPYKH